MIKTARRAKFAAGERAFAYAPLGYVRHPEIKNALAVDGETKCIIEKIFDLAVHGAGAAKIAKVPIAEKVSYKNKKRVRKPQEEWLRGENIHEAIIPKDVFNQVQEQIAGRRRQMKDATTRIFAGLVRCADCGWSMSFGTNRGNKRPFSYFNCTNYRQLGKNGGHCTAHYVRYDTIYAYVLSRIQYWAGQAELGEEQLLERLLITGDKGRAAQTKKRAAELAKAEKR